MALRGVDEERVAEVRARLNAMIGMGEVSRQVDRMVANARAERRRAEAGLPPLTKTMHLVFAGPPGTGKTTVASDVAQLYTALGLIPGTDGRVENDVYEVSAKDLIGTVMGKTQAQTKAAFDKARGGVLFIDEAYALHGGDQDMYGQQAIDVLNAEMDKHRDDTVVIMAGYPEDMERLMGTNAGLKSRMPTTINFRAYTAPEQRAIMSKFMADSGFKGAPGTKAVLERAVDKVGGGNAREVRNLFEEITTEQAVRLMAEEQAGKQHSKVEQSRLTPHDVGRGLATYLANRSMADQDKLRGPKPKPKAKAKA